MSTHVVVCSFTTLESIPARKRGNDRTVLAVLKEVGRFSVFDATGDIRLSRTLDRLGRNGMIRMTSEPFPWIRAEITEAGEALLETPGEPAGQQHVESDRRPSAPAREPAGPGEAR